MKRYGYFAFLISIIISFAFPVFAFAQGAVYHFTGSTWHGNQFYILYYGDITLASGVYPNHTDIWTGECSDHINGCSIIWDLASSSEIWTVYSPYPFGIIDEFAPNIADRQICSTNGSVQECSPSIPLSSTFAEFIASVVEFFGVEFSLGIVSISLGSVGFGILVSKYILSFIKRFR